MFSNKEVLEFDKGISCNHCKTVYIWKFVQHLLTAITSNCNVKCGEYLGVLVPFLKMWHVDVEHTYIKKHGWLFYCNTSLFRKPKLPIVACSITPSDNCVNIKACSWNRCWHSSIHKKSSKKFPWGFPFNAYLPSLTSEIWGNVPSLWQDVLLALSQNICNLVWS